MHFGTSSRDPQTFATVAVVLLGVEQRRGPSRPAERLASIHWRRCEARSAVLPYRCAIEHPVADTTWRITAGGKLTHARQPAGLDLDRAKRQVERAIGIADFTVGFALTVGGLALAAHWRLRYGGFGALRAFYLQAGWAFGALELLAGTAMLRRWAVRWILQMLPLVVPVIAYQYFILHFIFRRL